MNSGQPLAILRDPVVLFCVEMVVKGFLLLVLGAAVSIALRHAAAALRHLVWLVFLVIAATLPLWTWMLPTWRIVPRWGDGAEARLRIGSEQMSQATQAAMPLSAELPPPPSPTEQEPRYLANAPLMLEGRSTDSMSRIGAGLLSVWLGGSLAVLGMAGWSSLALRRLSRCAKPMEINGHISVLAAAVAGKLGLARHVTVSIGECGAMPMVWGIVRPHLLLPASSLEWDHTRIRAVLLHEFAHIRRHDPVALLIALFSVAVRWFDPLAWLAFRRLRIEQERACDNMVLEHGKLTPSNYAANLLAVATGFEPPRLTTGLAMARTSDIENRISSILDARNSRGAVNRWAAVTAVIGAFGLSIPIGMLAANEARLEGRSPRPSGVPGINVAEVKTTADFAEITVNQGPGALVIDVGEGAARRVIVHEFGESSGPIVFRVMADDRQGKWWDQVRLNREGESDASIPELPADWLPKGRVAFVQSPVKRADGAVAFAEVVSDSARTPIALRPASPAEVEEAVSRRIPRTRPNREVNLDCRIHALASGAPEKPVILPVMAAQDLVGRPRTALVYPYLTLQPGKVGKFDPMAGRTYTVEARATLSGNSVNVSGTIIVRLPAGTYPSAREALKIRDDESSAQQNPAPGKQLTTEFSADLGTNDALVVPIASEGAFPETLVAYVTARTWQLQRVRWQPPEARLPIELDGWVLTWPRAESEWFAKIFDYAGLSHMITRYLESRKSGLGKNATTSEAVGTMNKSEVEKLIEAFRGRSEVSVERVERFTARQSSSPSRVSEEERTHFSAGGEGASILPIADERTISLHLKWDAPSAPDGYGIYSGTSLCVLLPGPADPQTIRMLVLRAVDPNAMKQ